MMVINLHTPSFCIVLKFWNRYIFNKTILGVDKHIISDIYTILEKGPRKRG